MHMIHSRSLNLELKALASPASVDVHCDIFLVHLCHVLLCHLCISVHFRRPLSFKQSGVFTVVITVVNTPGHIDSHTAQSTHIGCGAGYSSFR